MVDPRTGYVYETEDSGRCGFYKFVPYRRGQLGRGGRLYMLKVAEQPNADLGQFYPIGTTWSVQWVRIDDPLALTTSVAQQGFDKGAASFRRHSSCSAAGSESATMPTPACRWATPSRSTIVLIAMHVSSVPSSGIA